MAMTRDQLRAARILLHLRQPELAELALMGVATLRRYEGGQDVGEIYVGALQRVIEEMGIVFLGEIPAEPSSAHASADGASRKAAPRVGVGVALRPFDELPAETIARLKPNADAQATETVTPATRPRGRPKKTTIAAGTMSGGTDGLPDKPAPARKTARTPKRRANAKPDAQADDD